MAAAERRTEVAEVDSWLEEFAGMRAQRVDFDVRNQLVSDYILPRRDFTVTQRPNQLRPHRVTSSVATNANTRMAALVLAYMIDYTRPFLMPNIKRGLVAAGRDTRLDQDSLDYLGDLEWQVFDHLMLPRTQLVLRLGSMLKEFCAFGAGVLWGGRRRGFGPYFNGRPVQACWWAENEEGVIDTLYFRMKLSVHRVAQKWPIATTLGGWENALSDRNPNNLTDIVLGCRPRAGGVFGAVREAKPFAFLAIAEEKGKILESSGYDSFPYSVFRYDPMPGNAYAEGPGSQVLPDVMVLNHLQQGIEDICSQKGMPPLAMPARMFGKPLDRRPGAVNHYNPAGLGLMRADQALMKLDLTGDPNDAMQYTKELTENIEIGYFTDWLRLRESGDMTAEEVNERRDMRLRGMASIVANCELPMSTVGDRALDVMAAEGTIPQPPAAIAGAEVDWEYAGPLAVAQLRGNAQAAMQLLNVRALVAKDPYDPMAAEAVDLEENMRVIAEALGAPTRAMNSRAHVAAKRAAFAQQQAQAADAQQAATVAGAAKDGAAAAGSAVSAIKEAAPPQPGAPGAAGPGAAAPFAPAAPFAQPIAA